MRFFFLLTRCFIMYSSILPKDSFSTTLGNERSLPGPTSLLQNPVKPLCLLSRKGKAYFVSVTVLGLFRHSVQTSPYLSTSRLQSTKSYPGFIVLLGDTETGSVYSFTYLSSQTSSGRQPFTDQINMDVPDYKHLDDLNLHRLQRQLYQQEGRDRVGEL